MGESEFFAQQSVVYRVPAAAGPPQRLGDRNATAIAAAEPAQASAGILDDAQSRIAFGGLLLVFTSFYVVTIS